MIASLTTRHHDWGILALGFSAGALIESALRLASGADPAHLAVLRLLAGAVVGPLVIWSLLLRATIPHRVLLAAAALAFLTYCALGAR